MTTQAPTTTIVGVTHADPALRERIGRRIREAREQAGLTQAQLALLFGKMARHTIGSWEDGTTSPTADQVARIAVRCAVSADFLLGLADEPTPSGDLPAGWFVLDTERVSEILTAKTKAGLASVLAEDREHAFRIRPGAKLVSRDALAAAEAEMDEHIAALKVNAKRRTAR